MATCVDISNNGNLVSTNDDVASCVTYLILDPSEYNDFTATLLGLDVATFFGGSFDSDVALAGFLGIISMFGIGFGVGIIINLTRKLRM